MRSRRKEVLKLNKGLRRLAKKIKYLLETIDLLHEKIADQRRTIKHFGDLMTGGYIKITAPMYGPDFEVNAEVVTINPKGDLATILVRSIRTDQPVSIRVFMEELKAQKGEGLQTFH